MSHQISLINLFIRNRNLQTSKEPLEVQAQCTSLFISQVRKSSKKDVQIR